jgi:hypothetical protein
MNSIKKFFKENDIKKIRSVLDLFKVSDDKDIKMLAEYAVELDRLDILKYIREKYNFDLMYDDYHLMRTAIIYGYYDIVEYLFSLMEDVKESDVNMWLHLADVHDEPLITKLIVSNPVVFDKLSYDMLKTFDAVGLFMSAYGLNSEEEVVLLLSLI